MRIAQSRLFRGPLILGAVAVGGLTADVTPATWQTRGTVISQAEAIVGRPATPRSAAGVARRSTRRAVRRRTL